MTFGRRATDAVPRDGLPKWVKWLLALVPLAGVCAGILRASNNVETRTHADSLFVRQDSFALYRASDNARHLRDSVSAASDLKDMRGVLFGLDSSDRCRRGQRGYCR